MPVGMSAAALRAAGAVGPALAAQAHKTAALSTARVRVVKGAWCAGWVMVRLLRFGAVRRCHEDCSRPAGVSIGFAVAAGSAYTA
jgi:hypothetical protein